MKRYIVFGVIIAGIIIGPASFSNNEPADKSELGRILFFDAILSKNNTISCASCHKPGFAFADTSATSAGVGGIKGVRNTPSAMNVRLQRTFFWDGRAKSLEEQALAPTLHNHMQKQWILCGRRIRNADCRRH